MSFNSSLTFSNSGELFVFFFLKKKKENLCEADFFPRKFEKFLGHKGGSSVFVNNPFLSNTNTTYQP